MSHLDVRRFLTALILVSVLLTSTGIGSPVLANNSQAPVGDPVGAPAVAAPVTAGNGPQVLLRAGAFDPLAGEPAVPTALRTQLSDAVPGLRIVQFSGPIQDSWYAAMENAGLSVVVYLPDYAYLVWGDGNAVNRLARNAPMRWSGVYQPFYALSPELTNVKADSEVKVVVQVYNFDGADKIVDQILGKSAEVLRTPQHVLVYQNLGVTVKAEQLNWLASLPGVVNVESYPIYEKMDEVQGQIMVGNLNAAGTQPSAPGYLAWLTGVAGMSTNAADYPIVDVTDDGIDNGTTTPLHPDFYTLGMTNTTDRLIYNQNWTTDAAADGKAGHGNLNASVVAGYNDKTGSAYEDANGYNYGLGINPFGRVAGSKVFCNSGNWCLANDDYTKLLSTTYAFGGRISTNSWGSNSGGAYSTDEQAYDALVRDAQPGTAFPGNQELFVVFSAGNAGSSDNTTGSPGNAKNVITVGAAENYRPTWTDGCNIAAAGADSAMDIISFSSRGPTDDARIKPDIVAPGTHIEGTASMATGYDGTGVCDKYMPTGQTLYAASSGTSHSAPAIAGAASLLYNYYQTHLSYGVAPSPAMLKAYLINSTRYLTGTAANDNLPSKAQGFGEILLSTALSPISRLLVDQATVFGATGESYQMVGTIPDSSQPFRVTLAWSDAPGATTGASYVNNLDLEVEIGGQIYKGNVFTKSVSMVGGTADARNNVESVFLPAGTSGAFTVRVKATLVAGDGLPGNSDTTDQDFALIVTNGFQGGVGVVTGLVSDGATSAPIAGAKIMAIRSVTESIPAISNAGGVYALYLSPATYTMTAAAYGYNPVQINGVEAVSGTTRTQNITMTAAPVYVISGVVTDSVTGDPLPATINVTGYPFNPVSATVQTNPATGAYAISLAGGQAYTLSVSSFLHTTMVRGIGTPTGAQTENFALVATTPNGGIEGVVTDYYTGLPLAGAKVTILTTTATADAQGYYQILGIPGNTYAVTATANLHSAVTLNNIVVRPSQLTSGVNFSLPSGHLVYGPAALTQNVPFSSVVTVTSGLVITNTGLGSLDFTILERVGTGYTPGLLAPAAADILVVKQSSYAEDVAVVTTALTTLGYTYDVIASGTLNTYTVGTLLGYRGMIYVGYATNSTNNTILQSYLDAGGRIFLADNDEGYYAGSTVFYKNYLDATYGGDDPGDGNEALVGEDIMAGLSVPSVDSYPDYYTIGGHSTTIFKYPTGQIGGSVIVSGTYQAVYLATDFRNLGTATVGEAIETEVIGRALSWLLGSSMQDRIPWLTETPVTGTVAGGVSATTGIELVWTSAISTVNLPGKYTATLELKTNDPNAQSVLIPVEMNVLPTATDGKLTGTVSTLGLCDENPAPLVNETVSILGADGFTQTLKTDAAGAYVAWLSTVHSPYTVTVAPAHHLTTSVAVDLSGNGATTTQDFELTLQSPCLRYTPNAISVTLMPGESALRTVVITGGNALPLDFMIQEMGNSGGASDAFGYSWFKSGDIGGPVYNWINATDGTKLTLSDDAEANITLPFAVPYYGTSATALRVGNNGAVLFNATSGEIPAGNFRMDDPSTSNTPNNLIAAFWDDMDDPTAAGAGVYWKTIGTAPNRQVIIEWYLLPHYTSGGGVGDSTFEMIISENGNIIYQYQDVDFGNASYNNGITATVGIRGGSPANSLTSFHNQASVQNGMAVCYRYPGSMPCGVADVEWMSESLTETTGLVNGASQVVSVTLDSSSIVTPGTYNAYLMISHNALLDAILLPVSMRVLGPDLTIVKNGPATAVPGDLITYTLTVTNIGIATATNTIVVDTLPAALTSSVPTTWSVGSLAPGATWTTSFTATVAANAAGTTVVNQATASATTDSDPANNTDDASTTILGSDLVVTQTGPTVAYPGRMVTYSIVVSNVGAIAATGVMVTDTLPTSVTSVVPTNWAVGTLAAGGVWSTTFTATVGMNVPAGTPLVNRVQAFASNESNPGDNSSQGPAIPVSPLKMVYLPLVLRNAQP